MTLRIPILIHVFIASFLITSCDEIVLFEDDLSTDSDTDADTDSDTDADTDSDTDADTDSDTDADTDSDTDADTDSDTDADTNPCLGIDCSGHGTCEIIEGQAVCDCEDGYINSPDPADCGMPEIEILIGVDEIAQASCAHDFGQIEVDGDGSQASEYITFTVKNVGSADLAIDDVYFLGGDMADFDLNDAVASPVAPGSEAEFAVRFDPQALSDSAVTIIVANSDADEGEYYFTVVGRGVDTTPPSLTNGMIDFSDIDDTGFPVSWTKASDFNTPQSELEYRLYRSLQPDIGALDDLTDEKIVMDWTADVSTVTETGLEIDTTYFFNVVVRDDTGNMRAYTMASQKSAAPILLYAFESETNLGGRTGADALCAANKPTSIDAEWNSKAFLSVSETDQIADFALGTSPIPDHVQIRGANDAAHVFAEDWNALWDQGPSMSLAEAGVLDAGVAWHSGSTADGTFNEQSCDGWTSSGNMAGSTLGSSDYTDNNWIYNSVQRSCFTAMFICMAWE